MAGGRVIGQDEAVPAVADAVIRARSPSTMNPQPQPFPRPPHPIGSFIFLGATGVGKTELARALWKNRKTREIRESRQERFRVRRTGSRSSFPRAGFPVGVPLFPLSCVWCISRLRLLAESLFDSEENIVRLDMSEYMEKHAVSRMIGAPPGYVGYYEGGQLTEAVRRRPYCVVLFDEIEKAHHDVFNVLLQVLDDGRLTDGQGHTVDFKNTVVIMTSNIGSPIIQEYFEQETVSAKDHTEMEARVKTELKRHFRPEFLNRVDDIIVFHRLSQKQLTAIVDIQLQRIEKCLLQQQLSLEVDRPAKQLLAKEGYDPQFGARPLKRTIQERLLDPLASKLLAGEFKPGDQIKATAGGGDLALQKK